MLSRHHHPITITITKGTMMTRTNHTIIRKLAALGAAAQIGRAHV